MLSNWLDASSTSNRYQQMYIKGFLDISGGNLILRNNNFYVLGGDSSLNNRLFVGGDVSINNRLMVGRDVTINGNLYANYPVNSIPASAIAGGLFDTGDSSDDLYLRKRLFIESKSIFNGDLSINQRVFVKGDSIFTDVYSDNLYENGNLISTK